MSLDERVNVHYLSRRGIRRRQELQKRIIIDKRKEYREKRGGTVGDGVSDDCAGFGRHADKQ